VPDPADIPGMTELWHLTLGDPDVRVAVVDGSVDVALPCFAGARLTVVEPTWLPRDYQRVQVPGMEDRDYRREHGTWVASVLFGQHGSPVTGLAPRCTGVIVPALRGDQAELDPITTARAIDAAVHAGADIILVQLCLPSRSGAVDGLLGKSITDATEAGVLVVAGIGNESGRATCFPAAIPEVLAVGAYNDEGKVLKFSNWGPQYEGHALVAPGANIVGAYPGGRLVTHQGASCSGPVATGVAALLVSLQRQRGAPPDPIAVRDALLASALPCTEHEANGPPRRCVDGKLNIPGATRLILATTATTAPGVTLAALPTPPPNRHVYALGTLGYDFGSEARRDSFKQLMAPVAIEGTVVPANPYDARQMVDHLSAHSSEARALIWTLNLELTPIYAIEPVGPYAAEVYQLMSTLLSGEVASEENDEFIERVSIPGRLTDRTVKLFSGQALPVVEVEQVRGLYGWRINTLIGAATEAARGLPEPPPEEQLRGSLREFLTRVYYDLRNLGSTSRDRALNFAATNAFQAAHTFASAVAGGMALDTIGVEKSPFCRMDSDCWDVKLRFFDPENSRRARKVFRFTIDVSDLMPVTLGVVRTWLESTNA
jgi:hypothetical protein